MYDAMVPCKGCSNKVPASSLKMDLDIGKMVCPDCVKNNKIHKEIEQEALHKIEKGEAMMKTVGNQPQMQTQPPHEPTPSRIAHKCTSCGYKFKIDPETRIPKNCPYCNSRVMSY